MSVPFSKPPLGEAELRAVAEAVASGKISGDGRYARRCEAWLESALGCARALITTSCTAGLEMAALLADIAPGDEVVMPSFTFTSTANAFVLRGAVPVFVDIRPDTLNLDETLVEAAITPRTRAIVPVHYAGVVCEMDAIGAVAAARGLAVIEDAAQALLSTYRGRQAGTFGRMAAFSFHETKNVVSGEGGALIVNDPALAERAEIVWEKGTNRRSFFRGEVDKYEWVDVGSSFLPSEIIAALLSVQLERSREIVAERRARWQRYHAALENLERRERLHRPVVPAHCEHNGHIYYVVLPDSDGRTSLLRTLNERGVRAMFHYVPLHSSPAGRRFGRAAGALDRTTDLAARMVRLPLYVGMTDAEQDRVVDEARAALA